MNPFRRRFVSVLPVCLLLAASSAPTAAAQSTAKAVQVEQAVEVPNDPKPASFFWGDYDGDGFEDAFVIAPSGQAQLLRNLADGTLEEVTVATELTKLVAPTFAGWADMDLDGDLDLFIGTAAGPSALFQNEGQGTFTEIAALAGLNHVGSDEHGGWIDYDKDGLPNLHVRTQFESVLYRNLGQATFERVELGLAPIAPLAVGPVATTGVTPDVEAVAGIAKSADETGVTTSPAGPAPNGVVTGTSGRRASTTQNTFIPTGGMAGTAEAPEAPGGALPLTTIIPCANTLKDQSGPGCLKASSAPQLGKLYPISSNLVVSSIGRVGIGTTSPTAKLDVDGAMDLSDSMYKDGALFIHTKGGADNTALGLNALQAVTFGYKNTAAGYRALFSNTSGFYNTASGARALSANTTGSHNTAHGESTLLFNTTGKYNTTVGAQSLAFNTTGESNTASGTFALILNTTGSYNTASGVNALRLNTTGYDNTAGGVNALRYNTTGARNTASGRDALFSNTTSSDNTASGADALYSNTTGSLNTGTGSQALGANTTGDYNTAVGAMALQSNTTAKYNTAIGTKALRYNTTGSHNTASGESALLFNTTGRYNTAVGTQTLAFNTTGYDNTANGKNALRFNTTASDNTASGSDALYSNTTGALNTGTGSRALRSNTSGERNTAVGAAALEANTVTSGNTALGMWALKLNTSGSDNTASGAYALSSNTTGSGLTANGFAALVYNTDGDFNTADGIFALGLNTSGYRNTAVGAYSLVFNTTGSRNAALGQGALGNNTTGYRNTAVGAGALDISTTGARNTALGYGAGSLLTTGSDNIAIGNNGQAADAATTRIGSSQTKTFIAGIRGVTTVQPDAITVMIDSNGQLGTVSSSRRFKDDVESMGDVTDKLLDLRPVVFRYKPEVQAGERPLEYGLIAEEVAEVFPDLVIYDDGGEPLTVKYHILSSMLLNELKKVSEKNAEQDSDLRKLRDQSRQLEALRRRVEALEAER